MMLPPHELKNKPFTKAIRGYSTAEVDEHIAFMIEKYTELYRENDEMERKLRMVLAQLDSYKNDEESIRTALINTQKACARITNEANTRAEVILNATKSNCDRILTEFHARIRKERDTLTKLENAVVSFKAALYQQYSTQIHEVEALTTKPEGDDIPDEEYVRKIVENIKLDVSRITSTLDNDEDGDTLPDELNGMANKGGEVRVSESISEIAENSEASDVISEETDAEENKTNTESEATAKTADTGISAEEKDDAENAEPEEKPISDSPDAYMEMLKEATRSGSESEKK